MDHLSFMFSFDFYVHLPGNIILKSITSNYRKVPKVTTCKERFSMNSLFASNIIYSFQIFALTLFLVIHTEFA